MENNKNMRPTIFAYETAKTYTLDEALKFLKEDFPVRNSGEELQKLIDDQQKKGVYIDDLGKQLGKQNLSNWRRGKKISREYAIKIMFALKINNISEAENFITRVCWEDGFYARDYKDIIYMFCLENNHDWQIAADLVMEYANLDTANADVSRNIAEKIIYELSGDEINGAKEYIEKVNWEKEKGEDVIHNFCMDNGIGFRRENEVIDRYLDSGRIFDKSTEYLEKEYYKLKDINGLRDFLNQNKHYFGDFNRTAYKIFMDYYIYFHKIASAEKSFDIYTRKESGDDIEAYTRENLAFREISDEINQISNPIKKSGLNLIQKIIAENMMNETERQKFWGIKNKKENVPRKYLILFYLLCNNEEHFDEAVNLLNEEILDKCGMPRLDSRNPFDWIVMNSLITREEDAEERTIDRLNKIEENILNAYNIDSNESLK